MTTEEILENYLIKRADWVPADEICKVFDVSERALRAVGDTPGLCTRFAISGPKGFKHVSIATRAEYLRAKHRLRRHAISELVRARDLDRRRQSAIRAIKRPPLVFERDSGQVLLSI